MKKTYDSLCCPHCGAKDIKLLYDDVFECEYCKQKFNFDLDEIEICSENKIFIDELKAQLNEQLENLQIRKIVIRRRLIETRNLAHPKFFIRFSLTCLIISLFLLFAYLVNHPINIPLVVVLSASIVSTVAYILAKIRCNLKYKRYQPEVSFYASEMVKCEEEIDNYTKILSKLTK